MKIMSLVLAAALALWFLGCSSCSSNNENPAVDTGTETTSTDGDTDGDSDGDADGDTDTETDTGNIVDAGPWDWEDLPSGEDCGTGCKQLTFNERVKMFEWDVWGDRLVYKSQDHSSETGNWVFRINVVDIANEKRLTLPKPYPDLPEGGLGFGVFSPAVKDTNEVFYSTRTYNEDPGVVSMIRADLDSKYQEFLWIIDGEGAGTTNGATNFEPARNLDVYGEQLVSRDGCNNNLRHELCHFPLPDLSEVGSTAGDESWIANLSLWGDVAVWNTWAADTFDVKAYDLSTSSEFHVVQDEEVQLSPRINGSQVVYQDLRFGDSDLGGNWNHSAIFVRDIQAEQTTQVTSGEWIGVYPDIYENIVVWADYRDSTDPNNKDSVSGVEIWGYNLDTSIEFQITNLPGRTKTTPRIWGDRVFVHMYKLDSAEDAIYMFDLPSSAK